MDARTRYTKMVVKNVFLELLKEKPLEKVTVKEICERAEINRGTFYKYYDNPFDLMQKLEDELLFNLQEKLSNVSSRGYHEAIRIVVEDVKENLLFYSMTFEEKSDKRFRERLFDICYGDNMEIIQAKFPNLDESKKEWMYFFVAEGCNGILKRWIDGGLKESVDDIATFAEKVIRGVNDNLPACL
ncbi:MAG: TetR/AcrR family transcriptional regulator [Lachnospiraceae bacterium]|nr:TetR/AcrR family transcriptional regulator [Lachnospiraceae bacterium]